MRFKNTPYKNETLFHLSLKTAVGRIMMLRMTSKQCFDFFWTRERFINGGEGGRKAKYS